LYDFNEFPLYFNPVSAKNFDPVSAKKRLFLPVWLNVRVCFANAISKSREKSWHPEFVT